MKLFCPNCTAVYDIKNYPTVSTGLTVQCSQCEQKWFQYNFVNSNEDFSNEDIQLRELANEEYQLTRKATEVTSSSIQSDSYSEQLHNRIEKSSDRLNESQKRAFNNDANLVKTIKENHKWTVIGFLTSSSLFAILYIIFIFNQQLQENFPSQQKILFHYQMIVGQIIESVKFFWLRIFQIFY